jgi:hypothetical protein
VSPKSGNPTIYKPRKIGAMEHFLVVVETVRGL